MSYQLPIVSSVTMQRSDLPLMMRLAQEMPTSRNPGQETRAQYGTHVQTTATQMDINVDWTFD